MSYSERLAVYKSIKERIARESKTPEEYERRVRALAKKLKI